jgi:hypothetical protein
MRVVSRTDLAEARVPFRNGYAAASKSLARNVSIVEETGEKFQSRGNFENSGETLDFSVGI